MEYGLLFDEANRGDIRSYLNQHNHTIDNALRKKWSLQIAEALAYVHQNGIIHSDIGTSNILVHQTGESIDLVLADFGGSTCLELNMSGHVIPGDAFLDPELAEAAGPEAQTLKLDIFSLGVVIYIIVTGHYPFSQGPAAQHDDCARLVALQEESARAQTLFKEGKFPNLSGVLFEDVIAGCCCERRFETAQEVVVALKADMSTHAS
jgi:serine/threonine protein kinase